MSEQARIETAIDTTIDNCEVLRARLAKYEDADGKALGVVVPEGWALAPSEIHLSAADIELISAMCGDGDEEAGYGPYQDGTLFIGYAQLDEGPKVYGLHLSCDECTEEGVTTLAEFAAPKPAPTIEPERQVTDGGRNPRYEGLFEGETEEQRASRLAPAVEPVKPEPIQVEAVAVTREDEDGELYLDWLLEGGISALEHVGQTLLIAHGKITDDCGSGTVYTQARARLAANAVVMPERRDFSPQSDSEWGWNACLDEVTRLNQPASAGDERSAELCMGCVEQSSRIRELEHKMDYYQARAALSANHSEQVRVVPVEPTEAMRKAAQDKLASEGLIVTDWLLHTAYSAMLAAAPSACSQEKE